MASAPSVLPIGPARPSEAAEKALRDSEERFRSLATLSSDIYWEQDEDYRFTLVLDHRADQARSGRGATLGTRRWEHDYVNMDGPGWAAHRADLEARRPFRDLELCRLNSAGEKIWVSVSGEPVFEGRRFKGYRGIGRDITMRKRAEEALRAAEADFRSIVENALEGIYRVDARGKVVTANPALARMLGYASPEEMFAAITSVAKQVYVDREERARYRERLAREGFVTGFETRWQRRDGSVLWVSLSGRAMRDPASGETYHLGTVTDISARKREERLLALEHDVSRCLAAAKSADEGVLAVLRSICESEGWECGRYFHHDSTAGVLRAQVTWARPGSALERFAERSRDVQYRPGEGLTGLVLESGEPLFVPNVLEDGRVAQKALAAQTGVHGALVFPVKFEGRILGVGSISSTAVHEPDERLLRTLQVLSEQLGQFLQRVRGEEAVRRQSARLSRLVQLQGKVAERGVDLRAICGMLVDAAREMVGCGAAALQFMEDGELVYFAASEEAKHLVGVRTPVRGNFSAAVLEIGKATRCDDTQSDARVDAEAARRAGARSLIGAPLEHQGRVIGVLKMMSPVPASFDDEQLHILQVLAGIGGSAIWRKQAESALRESELRFRKTFELAASGIAHVSLERRFVRVNRRLCEMLGYEPDELVGRSVRLFSHPEDVDVVDDPRGRVYRGEAATVRAEKRYLRKDGSTLWVRLSIALATSEAGEPQHEIAIFDDITERKNAEDSLRRFRTALDRSADMVFLVDGKQLRIVDANATACTSLGYERGDLIGLRPEDVVAGVTESAVRESVAALLANPERTDSAVRSFRRKDGTTFEGEALRRAIETPDGLVIVINARDLTERKLAQERQAAYVRQQEQIARFGTAALGKRDPAELIHDAVQTARKALQADSVTYLERGPAEEEVVLRGASGQGAEALGESAGCEALRLVFDQEQPAAPQAPGRALPFAWAAGLESALLVPVRGEEGVRGALCALSAARGAFGAEEQKFLLTAASVLSVGLRRIESEDRLAFLAQFDALTGLPNRALLSDRFSQMIVQARRRRSQLGVLFIDLDHFKVVNDSLGHAAGDELLKESARRLQASVRPGDTVARISGDEFAVILGDLARADDAALVAQKIIDRLAAPLTLGDQEVFVSASVGIAVYPGDGDEAEALLGAADAAMYRAKQSGRNAYQFYTAEINQRTRARAHLGAELRRALERDEFTLVYQPKFDLSSGKPCAAEALLRWRRSGGEMVSPAEFIPVLEETGLIVPVGEWVIRRACEDLREWREAGLHPLPVAVNLSARQFRQQDLDRRIRAIVGGAGVDPALLELEITESQLMHDPEHAMRIAQALREAGIRIAIDDFGTGYSSLAYLTRFAVSSLKIDRSFVADVLADQADAAIVRTIVDMAHTLGFTVVAEGVETEGQAAFLRGLGCEQAQGYFFARPMPAAQLQDLLRRGR